MRFLTQYDKRERVISNPGNPVRITYGGRYDDNGRFILEEKGKENLYDYIQSFADSVDIHVILQRFTNGEVDVMQKVQGMYGDFTQFPTTLAGMLNFVHDSEDTFKGLPADIRARFNNNFSEFLASSMQPDFFERLGVKTSPSPAVDTSSPTVAEQKMEEIKKDVAV